MERTSQLILRNAERLGAGPLLLVNPARDLLFRSLAGCDRPVRLSTQHHGDYRWLQTGGAEAVFEAVPTAGDGQVVFQLPREKDRLAMMLHALAGRMSDGASLWLAGENRAGIKSAAGRLGAVFGEVRKRDAARHCVLFEARSPMNPEPFSLDRYEKRWTADLAGSRLEVASLPGVFAHGRLDEGSRLLLETLAPLRPGGRILDLACGSGVVGGMLKAWNPAARVTLADVSALAVESSRRTLECNGLEAEVTASDGLSGLRGRFDWIVSNPPFHSGVGSDLDIAARFFAGAGDVLAARGKMVIVCNRHLPYGKWLQRHFGQVERLASGERFLVIRAGDAKSGNGR